MDKRKIFFLIILNIALLVHAQKENSVWHFGCDAGLDFNTNPPIVLTGTMCTLNGCSSIADANGNLLFYTDGVKIWNQSHQLMANGTGLYGNSSIFPALIVKRPNSSNLYYVFTMHAFGGGLTNGKGFCYSIVDMSMAAGMGSVTVKNSLIWMPPTQTTSNQLTGTKHCNGTDYWIVTHGILSTDFRSYLLTATGVNTTGVVTLQGDTNHGGGSAIKISPNGKKIAVVINNGGTTGAIAVHDFDNSTGVVSSNSMALTGLSVTPYGLEFSPDGTKLYGTSQSANPLQSANIYQWDLCAGNTNAVNASMQILTGPTGTLNGVPNMGQVQLASNGKIYAARFGQNSLAVINSPNNAGVSANPVIPGQFLYPNGSQAGLPNQITSRLRNIGSVYTTTLKCQQVQFSAPSHAQPGGCAATNYPLLSSVWNFGDPLSGNSNTSTVLNPGHVYTDTGSYIAKLILNYACVSDTFKQVVHVSIPNPNVSVSGHTVICKGESVTFSASAANSYSYSWSGSASGPSINVNPIVNSAYLVTATNSLNCTATKTVQLTVNKCLGIKDEVLDDVAIYPNPTTSNLFIETLKPLSVQVYNQLGQIIIEQNIIETKTELDLSNLSKGLYFIKVTDSNRSFIKRIVKLD